MKAILIIINMILFYLFFLKALVDMHIAQGLGLSTVEIKQ